MLGIVTLISTRVGKVGDGGWLLDLTIVRFKKGCLCSLLGDRRWRRRRRFALIGGGHYVAVGWGLPSLGEEAACIVFFFFFSFTNLIFYFNENALLFFSTFIIQDYFVHKSNRKYQICYSFIIGGEHILCFKFRRHILYQNLEKV